MVLAVYYHCGKHLELTEQIQQAVLALVFVNSHCMYRIFQVLHEELMYRVHFANIQVCEVIFWLPLSVQCLRLTDCVDLRTEYCSVNHE